jgi:membrane protease YdiL (CAAX protease family)
VSDRGVRNIAATGALIELTLAALALALGAIAGVAPLESFSWSLRDAGVAALATLPLLATFRLTWTSDAPVLRKIRDELERMLPALFGHVSTAGLVLVSLAAGIGEEVLFRGFLQAWLETILGGFGGLAAASLLFGVAHPITAGYVAIATLMGAYLGLLWQASGNLLAPIVTHALYDFVVLRLLLRPRGR